MDNKDTNIRIPIKQDLKKILEDEFKKDCDGFQVLYSVYPEVDKIYAMGDIHGDFMKLLIGIHGVKLIEFENKEEEKLFEKFRTELNSCMMETEDPTKIAIVKLSDEYKNYYPKVKWIGENSYFIQLGDQLDACRMSDLNGKNICHQANVTRCDDASELKIFRFLEDLHKKAKEKGGAVLSLWGNHEHTNIDYTIWNKELYNTSYEGRLMFLGYNNQADNKFIKDIDKVQQILIYTIYNHIINSDEFKGKILTDCSLFINALIKRIINILIKHPNDLQDIIGKQATLSRLNSFAYGQLKKYIACTRVPIAIIGDNLFVHGGFMPAVMNRFNIKSKDDFEIITLMIRKWILRENIVNSELKEMANDKLKALNDYDNRDVESHPTMVYELLKKELYQFVVNKLNINKARDEKEEEEREEIAEIIIDKLTAKAKEKTTTYEIEYGFAEIFKAYGIDYNTFDSNEKFKIMRLKNDPNEFYGNAGMILFGSEYDDSILWTRDQGLLFDEKLNNTMTQKTIDVLEKLKTLNINKIIVGHTVQSVFYKDTDHPEKPLNKNLGINAIYNGKIWKIDVGMSKSFDVGDQTMNEYRKVQVLELSKNKQIRIHKEPFTKPEDFVLPDVLLDVKKDEDDGYHMEPISDAPKL